MLRMGGSGRVLLAVTIVVQQCVRRYFASQSSCSHFHGCMVLHDVCMGMVVLHDAHCHGCMVLHDVCMGMVVLHDVCMWTHIRQLQFRHMNADAYSALAKLCSAANS